MSDNFENLIGASLSEPHTAFAEVVCTSACGHIP